MSCGHGDGPIYDAACFHAQQCAEKYLKARLQDAIIPFGRTHNLIALLTQVLSVEPTWTVIDPMVRALTGFAVDVRYPGVAATKADARLAVAACREMRRLTRLSLGLVPYTKAQLGTTCLSLRTVAGRPWWSPSGPVAGTG